MAVSAGAPARAVTGTRWGDRAVRLAGWRPGMIGDPVVSERYALLRRHSHPGARTLDAGCGSGWFALYLASRGNKVTGISFDPAANAAARRRAEILGHDQLKFIDGDLADLSQLTEGLDPFDEIVCFETIEHIHDDGALINGLAKLLRPGGRMFLTTPSDDHRELALDRAAAEAVGGHVRFGYSFSRLGELCAAAGLDLIEERRLGGPVVQWLYELIAVLTPKIGIRLAVLSVSLLFPLKVLDRPLGMVLGTKELCVAIVAQRPE